MIFVGYESGSKAWRFYDPSTRRVTVSHDVVFDESRKWKWDDHGNDNIDPEPFTIEYTAAYTSGAPVAEEVAQETPTPGASPTPAPASAPPTPDLRSSSPLHHQVTSIILMPITRRTHRSGFAPSTMFSAQLPCPVSRPGHSTMSSTSHQLRSPGPSVKLSKRRAGEGP